MCFIKSFYKNNFSLGSTLTNRPIYNPGTLVHGTDLQMFADGEKGSMIRNPLIATVHCYNRTIDAFGTGVERVFKFFGNEEYQYININSGFLFSLSGQLKR